MSRKTLNKRENINLKTVADGIETGNKNMAKKVYIITIKENDKLASFCDAYESFEKAKNYIQKLCAKNNIKMVETDMRNEFKIFNENDEYIHTLTIIDLWLR